ncbi:MAG: glucosyltransferase domain-containing protein [Pseudomonas sp.]
MTPVLMHGWDKVLDRRKVLLFFLFATFAYIYPLILADYSYLDDNWRSLDAGNGWAVEGRLFVDLFYKMLTFGSAAPNIFPLPLMVATLAMALGLTELTFHFYPQPTISCCLVMLPLWYNPFFLQNLSYQYDGPAMALSQVVMIYAIIFRTASRTLQLIVPAFLIALGLGLYQISVNVFLGLCCLELLRGVNHKIAWSQWCGLIGWKVAQVMLAWVIYWLTAYSFMSQDRVVWLSVAFDSLLQLETNIFRVLEAVALLVHGGFSWVFAALAPFALAGSWQIGVNVLKRQDTALAKAVISLLCLLTVPAVVLLVSGAALFFKDFNAGLRLFMGFSVLLILLFYLTHQALAPRHRLSTLLLIVPLLAMLSLSYAYGRVLTMQKTFETSVLFALGYDITTNRQLRDAKRIYLTRTYSDYWLVAASGSFKQMPILRHLLSVNVLMLAENLTKVGVTNVVAERKTHHPILINDQGIQPLIESKFYSIYLVGDQGYIVVKAPAPILELHW